MNEFERGRGNGGYVTDDKPSHALIRPVKNISVSEAQGDQFNASPETEENRECPLCGGNLNANTSGVS
jgi:hypothetical protein